MYDKLLYYKIIMNAKIICSQVDSPAKSPLPNEQMLSNWIWRIALRLCLHEHMLPCPAQFRRPGEEIPDINADATLHPIQAALKEGCPLANYVALVMTKYGHRYDYMIAYYMYWNSAVGRKITFSIIV